MLLRRHWAAAVACTPSHNLLTIYINHIRGNALGQAMRAPRCGARARGRSLLGRPHLLLSGCPVHSEMRAAVRHDHTAHVHPSAARALASLALLRHGTL